MTREELKQEAEELIQRFEMANSMNCYMSLTPDRKQIGEMLVMIAEPREKRIAEQEELLNSTLEENKDIYKKMADLDTSLEDCTESLTDARIKIKELEKELEQAKKVQVVEHFEAYGQCRDSRRIAGLEQENAELKVYNEKLLNSDIEKHNKIVELNDKLNNLSKVAEVRLANWQKYEKAYNETEELLDKQIEATYKLFEENKELKRQVEQKQHLADVRLEQSLENYKLFSDEQKARIDVDIALDDMTDQLSYAKTIIQDLLDNTDEYARQKAEDFLKEDK